MADIENDPTPMTAFPTLCEIPADAIPLVGIEVVQFMDSDGMYKYALRHTASASFTQLLGVLEWTKFALYGSFAVPDIED